MSIFRFNSFTLDTDRYELTEGSQTLALPRVAMELLILLVQSRGTLVTRHRIASTLWAGVNPESTMQSISTAINRVRTTLHDDPADPVSIQTVIGKGYRFIAPVQEQPSTPDLQQAPARPDVEPSGNISLEKLHAWYVNEPAVELSILHLNGRTTVISPRGDLVLGASLKVAELQIQAEIEKSPAVLILDLTHVSHVDSAGLGLLVYAFGLMHERAGHLRLCSVQPRVLRLLRTTCTDSLLPTDSDIGASLAASSELHP